MCSLHPFVVPVALCSSYAWFLWPWRALHLYLFYLKAMDLLESWLFLSIGHPPRQGVTFVDGLLKLGICSSLGYLADGAKMGKKWCFFSFRDRKHPTGFKKQSHWS
ncbi:uncharacterized protein LOC120015518 isoform X2 [Tripterygium wilfordii]|uniref:uncharacterized protein LOC119988956 isoform X2 n=1 Tax=Tripterygium wilfordii TaxID=458696 RepID=UPI0018F819AE|nr:uncharacterized protein LOC119988956 isoform X2 [Tripterygium wilfordii]XP_038723904.1 uncharacterized protein LOC120015518 isoform X2 [Tripterygium wilfordii]